MRTYAERARAIQPTGVRKMFDLAGEDTFPSVWASRISTPARGHRSLPPSDVGRSEQVHDPGLPALREAIAKGWDAYAPGMTADNVCITMSGTNALMNPF